MVTIGVTGHRFLAEPARLGAALADVVARLALEHPERWTVLSALAEGADRMVTQCLLDRPGTRLVAVLPLGVEDYENDFDTEASRAEFRALLGRADNVVVIAPTEDRDGAYEACGREVLDRSDLLVALWNGRGAQGVGGTGGIVARARALGRPVVWVHAGNRRPGTDEPTSLGADQGRVTWEGFSP